MTDVDAPVSIGTIPRFVHHVGSDRPADQQQVVEVVLDLDSPTFAGAAVATVAVSGRGVSSEPVSVDLDAPRSRTSTTEVALLVDADAGDPVEITVTVHAERPDSSEPTMPTTTATATATASLRIAEPGTVVHLVSHFHMDPVWWNTQAASVSELDRSDWSASPRLGFQRSAFTTLGAHLARADRDDDYRFCVAEVDYLRPFVERFPGELRRLRRLVVEGRVEVVGATHNEPNSNLTNLELTRRNLVDGLSFQRGVLGAAVSTAWQLDVFGHHPMFPSALAEAGVRAVALARGPYRPWGPMLTGGFSPPHHPVDMQMHTETEWLAPDGRSATLTYLAGHYSTGWTVDGAPSLAAAADRVVDLAGMLRSVAATRHVMVLVGTDLSPPARYLDELGDHVARRWSSPEVRCSTPAEFLAAVEHDLAEQALTLTPQSRDLNPVYTGKDVSYIDTKQAHRHVEQLVLQAETWSTLAGQNRHGRSDDQCERDDRDALDRAWRLLVYASHHDALTGTESDQVYIDLLVGWREARDLALDVRTRAVRSIATATGPTDHEVPVTVFGDQGADHVDIVRVTLGREVLGPLATRGLDVIDHEGRPITHVVDHASFTGQGTLAAVEITLGPIGVPGVGHRTVFVRPAERLSVWHTVSDTAIERTDDPGGHQQGTPMIASAAYSLVADPSRGGCITSWVDRRSGDELITSGRLGNELLRWPEYPAHPELGEGPWHIAPCGPPVGTADRPARVTVEHSEVGERLTAHGHLGDLAVTSRLTLWTGLDRVDGLIDLPDVTGHDGIVRVRWPCDVTGCLPIVECDGPVLGRGFAHPDVDAADTPWTLDTPAYAWFGIGSVARIDVVDPEGVALGARAIGIAEIVVDDARRTSSTTRELVVALARSGVTATVTGSAGPRYGALSIDSNLPDVRLVVGVAGRPGYAADVLAAAPAAAAEVERQLDRDGAARVLVWPTAPLRRTWGPAADVRHDDALPVVFVLGRDDDALRTEIGTMIEELTRNRFRATTTGSWPHADELLDDRTVGWVNTGTPGCAVDTTGALHMSLLRGSTGWPSGQWIDPPARAVPDGTSFQSQHWSHRFVHSLVAGRGGWRDVGLRQAAAALHRPPVAVALPPRGATATGPPAPTDQPVPVGARVRPVRLVTVEPASVRLATVKRPGFATTAGWPTRAAATVPADRSRSATMVVRCEETTGRDTTARIRCRDGIVAAQVVGFDELGPGTDLVVDPDGSIAVPIPAWSSATVRITERGAVGDQGSPPPADPDEPTEPLRSAPRPTFSRYWVQNTGPVPLGGLPLAVHLHAPLDPSRPDPWRVSIALSDTHPRPATVEVTAEVPDGWSGELSDPTVEVEPGKYVVVDLHMGLDAHTGEPVTPAPGFHLVRVVGRLVGEPESSAAYDEHVLARSARGSHIVMDDPVEPAAMRPGERAELTVRLTNRADRPTWGVLDVVSPWGSWELLPIAHLPFDLDPDVPTDVRIPIEIPSGHPAGRWWVLVRARVGEVVRYSDSVWLTVTDPATGAQS